MKLYKILGLLGYDPELPLFININLLFNWAFNVTFREFSHLRSFGFNYIAEKRAEMQSSKNRKLRSRLKSFRGKINRISVHQIGGTVLKRVKGTHKAVFFSGEGER